MPDEKMSAKKFIKVWSQAGASLVAAVVALALGFEWVTWTQQQVALVMGVYAALMMLLRQMFSVTEEAAPIAGDIVVVPKPGGGQMATLELNDGPEELLSGSKLTFNVKIPSS